MRLHADIALRIGELAVNVDLEVPAGAVTALLGPNGAGKTTILRCIAGTLGIDGGTIALGEQILDRPPATFVPPEQRNFGVVHQDYLLFPHLTALENVAFGPRSRGTRPAPARDLARQWLTRVGVAEHAGDRPRTLSGGQAQRVALARALATDPAALLLDEPLAALDAGTRVEVRRDLRRFLADYPGPTVLVTHDPVDALALADSVAIVEQGRLVQTGTLSEVTTGPRSRYVADLIGTNLVRGVASGNAVTTEAGVSIVVADSLTGPVFVTIAPAAVALHQVRPEGSPRNRWEARIAHLDLLGDRVRVQLAGPLDLVAEVTPAAATELGLREGDTVWASVKATEVSAYPS
jgi:molybdate transport system ATP-binding protein